MSIRRERAEKVEKIIAKVCLAYLNEAEDESKELYCSSCASFVKDCYPCKYIESNIAAICESIAGRNYRWN